MQIYHLECWSIVTTIVLFVIVMKEKKGNVYVEAVVVKAQKK